MTTETTYLCTNCGNTLPIIGRCDCWIWKESKTTTFPLRAEMPTNGDVPGSFNFTCSANDIVGDEQTSGMHFSCPCGCGNISYLAFTCRPDSVRGGGPEWEWNGDREKPTLTPSVLQSGLPCKWHGYLREGYWVLS